MIANTITNEMARYIACCPIDLGDEREVIRALTGARYRAGDIVTFIDEVIDTARVIRAEKRGVL